MKVIVSFFESGIGAYTYLSYAQMWQNMCNQLKQQVYSQKRKKKKKKKNLKEQGHNKVTL